MVKWCQLEGGTTPASPHQHALQPSSARVHNSVYRSFFLSKIQRDLRVELLSHSVTTGVGSGTHMLTCSCHPLDGANAKKAPRPAKAIRARRWPCNLTAKPCSYLAATAPYARLGHVEELHCDPLEEAVDRRGEVGEDETAVEGQESAGEVPLEVDVVEKGEKESGG